MGDRFKRHCMVIYRDISRGPHFERIVDSEQVLTRAAVVHANTNPDVAADPAFLRALRTLREDDVIRVGGGAAAEVEIVGDVGCRSRRGPRWVYRL